MDQPLYVLALKGEGRLALHDGGKDIFLHGTEGEGVRRREGEIIGDSKSDETLAAISEKSAPFHFIALVVGPFWKYGNVAARPRRIAASFAVDREKGTQDCSVPGETRRESRFKRQAVIQRERLDIPDYW